MCKQEIASQAELFSPPSCSLLGAQVALAEPEANLARKIGGMSDIPKARQLVLTVADQADLGASHHPDGRFFAHRATVQGRPAGTKHSARGRVTPHVHSKSYWSRW